MKNFSIAVLLFFSGIAFSLIFNPNTQTEEIPEHPHNNVETVTVIEKVYPDNYMKEVPFDLELTEHSEEMIDYGYIKLEDCIPLTDITGYYYNEYDYPVFELGDVGKQFDDVNGISYQDIMEKLPKIK